MKDAVCCPKFDVKKWDNKTFVRKSKPFIQESIPQLFHIPFFPMTGKKITKMWNLAEASKAMAPNKEDTLIMFHDPSAFKSEIYFSVTKNVSKANNVKLSGTFMSKVFEGPYNAIPGFIKQMDQYLATKKKRAKRYYIHYAYCPKCEKKYGHHYMLFLAQV